ncbi:beta-1,3-galactosyltransferase 5-like [Haemaphysalis longicornis]
MTPTATNTPVTRFGWKVKCACASNLRVLYYVHTPPDHTRHRQLLRNTIGNSEVAAFLNSSLVFFVGTTHDQNLREKVHQEAEREGDVVELDFFDSYRNLTHKFIGATKWLTANECLNSSERVVVKLDDDVVVNVFLLSSYVEYLLALDHSVSPSIHCASLLNERPIRRKNSKWFVSRQEYPSFKYPPYCPGAAFLMHVSVLAMLGREVHRVPFFWVDDVYATGLVARSAKVVLVDIKRHFILHPENGKVDVSKNTLFIHIEQHEVLFERSKIFWNSIMMQNSTR